MSKVSNEAIKAGQQALDKALSEMVYPLLSQMSEGERNEILGLIEAVKNANGLQDVKEAQRRTEQVINFKVK